MKRKANVVSLQFSHAKTVIMFEYESSLRPLNCVPRISPEKRKVTDSDPNEESEILYYLSPCAKENILLIITAGTLED